MAVRSPGQRIWWIGIALTGVAILGIGAAQAGTEIYGGVGAMFGPPSSSSPWVLGGGTCVPAESDVPPRPSIRARRPHRPHFRSTGISPEIGTAALSRGAICLPDATARDIATAAGSAVFDMVNAGAAARSSVTLRTGDGTTVTIIVSTDKSAQGSCVSGAAGSPADGAMSTGSADVPPATPAPTPGSAQSPFMWGWTSPWAEAGIASGPASGSAGGTDNFGTDNFGTGIGATSPGRDVLSRVDSPSDPAFTQPVGTGIETGGAGIVVGGVSSTGGSTGPLAELEPSTLTLLGSSVGVLYLLARRRRA
jgi:hypothetical protein